MSEKTVQKSLTSDWFETKLAYEKIQEDGTEKTVTELYVVDALSFGEAEAKIIKEMSTYVSGEFKVKNINPAKYHEVFFSDDDQAYTWFKAKLEFITIDERTEKEKRSAVFYLVQGKNFDDAKNIIKAVMDGTMIDYVISSVAETKIMDLFAHEVKRDNKHE